MDITTLTPALREQYGFTPTSGVVVLDVISGSPAKKAGLMQGDVIVAVDGTAVSSASSLQSIIGKDKSGQNVQIAFYRGDIKHTTTVTLGSQAEAQAAADVRQSVSGSGDRGSRGPRVSTPASVRQCVPPGRGRPPGRPRAP